MLRAPRESPDTTDVLLETGQERDLLLGLTWVRIEIIECFKSLSPSNITTDKQGVGGKKVGEKNWLTRVGGKKVGEKNWLTRVGGKKVGGKNWQK